MGEKREPEYHLVTEKQDNLLSEFLKIDGQVLRAVWYVWEVGSLDKVVLAFDEGSLIIEALIDDDTLDLRYVKKEDLEEYPGAIVGDPEVWSEFICKPFGWGWITINQQNYLDGVLLSFDGIRPNIVLNVLASSIYVGSIGYVPTREPV